PGRRGRCPGEREGRRWRVEAGCARKLGSCCPGGARAPRTNASGPSGSLDEFPTFGSDSALFRPTAHSDVLLKVIILSAVSFFGRAKGRGAWPPALCSSVVVCGGAQALPAATLPVRDDSVSCAAGEQSDGLTDVAGHGVEGGR